MEKNNSKSDYFGNNCHTCRYGGKLKEQAGCKECLYYLAHWNVRIGWRPKESQPIKEEGIT